MPRLTASPLIGGSVRLHGYVALALTAATSANVFRRYYRAAPASSAASCWVLFCCVLVTTVIGGCSLYLPGRTEPAAARAAAFALQPCPSSSNAAAATARSAPLTRPACPLAAATPPWFCGSFVRLCLACPATPLQRASSGSGLLPRCQRCRWVTCG